MAVFLRKEPEWNQGGSEGGSGGGGGGNGAQTDGAVENAEGVIEGGADSTVRHTYPEVITSLDEIHEVGTLAQVRVPVLLYQTVCIYYDMYLVPGIYICSSCAIYSRLVCSYCASLISLGRGVVCIGLYTFVEAFPEDRWFWVVPSS